MYLRLWRITCAQQPVWRHQWDIMLINHMILVMYCDFIQHKTMWYDITWHFDCRRQDNMVLLLLIHADMDVRTHVDIYIYISILVGTQYDKH